MKRADLATDGGKKKNQGATRTKKEKKIKYDFIKQQNINREEYLHGASADDKGKIYLKIESLAQ